MDFLKYVDDIEKGNTIKRVHIQRRAKGPPKFSTLPRNFSLPGHGTRPIPKDPAWSGTSTLGPKPKSRVTEVQQIFDLRPIDGGTSSQSSKGTTSQVAGYVPAKPREEAGIVGRLEEKSVGIQARPNLLRASSMPITLQQRKGSDSSSPDRLGTPENGSTENVFRASPDITERRCIPQERTGLHQQITVALKRVRELEEQVKTIPELKAQICSLREEREQLLLQLQAKTQSLASTSSSIPVHSSIQQKGRKPSGDLTLPLETSDSVPTKVVTGQEKQGSTEKSRVIKIEREMQQESVKSSLAHGNIDELSEQQRKAQPSEKSDTQTSALVNPVENAAQKLSQDIAGQELTSLKMTMKQVDIISNIQDGKAKEEGKGEHFSISSDDDPSVQKLQEKLMMLEAKLTRATQDLEKTSTLLKEQIQENKVKEEKILQLSEGIRVEVCTTETESRPRRESIDKGTEMANIDLANRETETEMLGTVDQGTDTEKICVEVYVPEARDESIDQGTETQIVNTHEEVAAGDLPRPRANSIERSTETEKVATQDQMTETPVAESINQVVETEGETDHPFRPRAGSVDQGTETDRVNTVDRVTETEMAQSTDQQTETEMDRRQANNPARDVEPENEVRDSADSQRVERVDTVVSGRVEDKETNEVSQRENEDGEDVVIKEVIKDSAAVITETVVKQTLILDIVAQDERDAAKVVSTGENKDTESKIEESTVQSESETKQMVLPESVVTEIVKTEQLAQETVERKQTADSEVVCVTIKETVVTDTVVVAAESSAVKTVAPVRPQRGKKPATEQSKPSTTQLQAAPVRPRRGSSESQAQMPQPQAQAQAQGPAQVLAEAGGGSSETQSQQPEHEVKGQAKTLPQAEDRSLAQSPPGVPVEGQSHPQVQTEVESHGPSPGSGEAQTQPQTIEAQSQSQTSATLQDSKELPTPPRASQARPTRQGSSDAQRQSQGSRRSSTETQPPRRDSAESQVRRRGSSEAAQRRGSTETQASRRDIGEAQPLRRGSSESATSPAALGQVVTRLTGLLGEQWAQLGSGTGAQQTATQQESPSTQKQTAGKRATAAKGASAKPVGKAAPAATTGKPAGKPGASKMSSIQSQLVSSLSVLSAFYSPGQKAAAASKQQEQGRPVVHLGPHENGLQSYLSIYL